MEGDTMKCFISRNSTERKGLSFEEKIRSIQQIEFNSLNEISALIDSENVTIKISPKTRMGTIG